jgi:hypothetical protein
MARIEKIVLQDFKGLKANKTQNVKRNQRPITFYALRFTHYALRFTPNPTNSQRAQKISVIRVISCKKVFSGRFTIILKYPNAIFIWFLYAPINLLTTSHIHNQYGGTKSCEIQNEL